MWGSKQDVFGKVRDEDAEHDDTEHWSVPLWLQIAVGVMVGVLAANAVEYFVARAYARAVIEDGVRVLERSIPR